jgi:hypothetical protein
MLGTSALELNNIVATFAILAAILALPKIIGEKLNLIDPQLFIVHHDELLQHLEQELAGLERVREFVDAFFEDLERISDAELRDLLRPLLSARTAILEVVADPGKMHELLVRRGTVPRPLELIALLGIISAFSVPLPGTGKTILDHIICLDAFATCGRYVEPVDNTTTLEVFKRNKDKAVHFIASSAMLTLTVYSYHLIYEKVVLEASKQKT